MASIRGCCLSVASSLHGTEDSGFHSEHGFDSVASTTFHTMTTSPDKPEYRYEVAISFAGPHREKVRAIAERLSEAIDPGIEDHSKGRVFFDEWFGHEIVGPDMELQLQRIYHEQSLMIIADLSEDYADRKWTQAEARAIRGLRMNLDTARDETARLRVLSVRFDAGNVPGVGETEGSLDGIHLSAEEIADVILKRRELLRERLGSGEASVDDPPAIMPKSWVWHSTLATRAADQVSVLAVVETLLAIVLYWWIAIRFDTHLHLISSVFIAPLLLLRSPESIDAGVRWFMKDWFGQTEFEKWPLAKRVCWIMVLGVITCGATYCFSSEIRGLSQTDLQGWPQFRRTTIVGTLSFAFAVAFAVAVTGAFSVVDTELRAVTPVTIAGASFALLSSSAGELPGLVAAVVLAVAAVAGAIVALVPAIGIGLALRALVFRVIATVYNLPAGIRRLPANWRENNFLTDSRLPAELMPGIRDQIPLFSQDGLKNTVSDGSELSWRIIAMLLGIFLFLPAFLYRLNIKATAWFWWPLAFLLKPAPAASAESEQRQALCWPWSNPAQRWWIMLSIGLALLSGVLHWLVNASRIEPGAFDSLSLPVKVFSGIGWARLGPWHWALWIIAGTGTGMLLLAGNACSHYLNGNWTQFRRDWLQNIRWMTALYRIRRLATVALLAMAFGALLLQDRTWQDFVPVPGNWVTAIDNFFQAHR